MKIAFITAGAAGMYCGSCLRDNALARALMRRGHDVVLVPTYTPTRTDEPNVSIPRVFLGGINVYLQQKSAIFRHTPEFVDQLFDSPRLIDWVARRFGMKTEAADLGSLTVAMLEGESGPDHKEFLKLARWLADEVKPDIVDLSNGLLLGLAAPLKRLLGVPVICTLSGEDLFLDCLPEPWRSRSIELLRALVADADDFITFSRYYADFMRDYLGVPLEKVHILPLGISLDGHGVVRGERTRSFNPKPQATASPATSHAVACGSGLTESDRRGQNSSGLPLPLTIGYLARICPEKGLHQLVEAFRLLREQPRFANCRLRVAGYLGPRDRAYFDDLVRKLSDWGLAESFDYIGEPDRAGKIAFLQSLDVFSVPTVYRESKGLPVLEAWANRVPVVEPWHGAFPEYVNESQAGVLVPPNDPQALADAIAQLLDNEPLRRELGSRGRAAVERTFNVDRMADATLAVYERHR